MNDSSQRILKEVLLEYMETEAAQVPPTEELMREHTFSGQFLKKMKHLLTQEERDARRRTSEKMAEQDNNVKKSGVFRKKPQNRVSLRVAAACLVCVIVFGAGWTIYRGGFGLTSSDSSATDMAAADSEEAATEEAAGTYGWDNTEAVGDAGGDVKEYDTTDDAAYEEYDDADTSISVDSSDDTQVSESAAADESYSQKLIKTVDMTVETTEFDELIAQLESKTEELGGYVESSETSGSSSSAAGRWSYLTIRIPADSLDEFVSLVGENANVTYTSESTEDVTLTYVDMESHLTALRTEQESLLAMLEQADSVESILAIQSQLTEVRYEIESYESQLRVYDNRISYSTVYLSINEVERESSAAAVTFGESVKTKFSDNVYRIGQGFKNFAIGFLGALPFIIVVAVIIAVIFVVCRCALRRKERKIERALKKAEENVDEED